MSLILWEVGFGLDWVTTVIGVSIYGISWEGNNLAKTLLLGQMMLPWHLLHVLLTVFVPLGLVLTHRRGYVEGRILSLGLIAFAITGITFVGVGIRNIVGG